MMPLMKERSSPRISIFPQSQTAQPFASTSSTSRSWMSLPWRHDYSQLPTTSGHSSPDMSLPRPQATRRKIILISCLTLGVIFILGAAGHYLNSDFPDRVIHIGSGEDYNWRISDSTDENLPEKWGWHEAMGWEPEESLGLADLGELAEERYRLGISDSQAGRTEYFNRISLFASSLGELSSTLLSSIQSHLPPSLRHLYSYPLLFQGSPSMISYKNIHQTDKQFENRKETQQWVAMNAVDGWKLNFLDDPQSWLWVEDTFGDTDINWAWRYMHRGVLRADFLRYLLPLVEGGVYSDVDTIPIRPIEEWGHTDVEYLDLSNTDGPDWDEEITTFPSVVVAIDVDVHAHPNWAEGWPRPLGICQWTLSSAPHHPIFIDAARRVVNATRFVEQWENDRADEIQRLKTQKPEGYQSRIEQLSRMSRSNAMEVMDWTGPGLFTDSVLAYILARYQVTWHRLRGLTHPLRIGEVLILPITAFSPGGEEDFRAEGPDSPQANVLHEFRGSWKGDGA